MKYEVDNIPRSETIEITLTLKFADRQVTIDGIPSGSPSTYIEGFRVSAPENQDDIPDSVLFAAHQQFEGSEKAIAIHIEQLLKAMLRDRTQLPPTDKIFWTL